MNFNLKKFCLYKNSKIIDAIEKIEKNGKRIVLIINKDQKLLGTITDGDIRRSILKSIDMNQSVETIMEKSPLKATNSTSIKDIISKMKDNGYFHLPIVDSKNRLSRVEFLEDFLEKKERDNFVFIMAGGLGRRMKTLTKQTPKPMLHIQNKPIIEHTILKLREQGFKNFIISVNYLYKQIMSHFKDGKKFDVNIDYIVEKKQLGTAGSLYYLNKKIVKPFVVINGDIFTEAKIDDLLMDHQKKKLDATVCIKQYFSKVPFGVVDFKKNNFEKIDEKPIKTFFISAGINIFSPNVSLLVAKYFEIYTV